MELGVLIVTYNSEACLTDCLDSCRLLGLFEDGRVLVVDNASEDGSVTKARDAGAKVIANDRNLGFAAAVNQGTASLDTPFVLLLNPDTKLRSGVRALVEDCHSTGAAAAGGMLTDASGGAQSGFQVRRFPTVSSLAFEALGLNRVFPWNPVNRKYRCLDLDPDVAADVEQPAGAFLLFRKESWSAVGGFDERFYPLWFEDVDFLKRLSDSGQRIRYVPQAVAEHAGGHSLASLTSNYRQLHWYGNLLTYLALHHGSFGRAVVAAAVVVGVTLRSVMGTIRFRTGWPLAVHGEILRMAASCVLEGKTFADKRIAGGFGRQQRSVQIDEERFRRSA